PPSDISSDAYSPRPVHTVTARANRGAPLAFGSAILIMLAVGLFSYRAMTATEQSDRLVEHTHEVLDNLGELSFAVQGIESKMRGFVLTGQNSYSESYRASIEDAGQN